MTIDLAPEIETELRAQADILGIPVTEIVAKALDAYLQNSRQGDGVRSGPRSERRAEMAWAARPDSRFIGQWVVLEGDQVVANGTNAKQTYEAARRRGIASPFVIYVSGEEQEPFAGGWLD